MECVFCGKGILYVDNLSFWIHVDTHEEECRRTFATPTEADTTCKCGHNRVFHALREDVYSCFAKDCKCFDFEGPQGGL